MKCSLCQNLAITTQKYSGLHLCDEHFLEDVERKVRETIIKSQMVQENDRIAIALSGGKDSTALIYLLSEILSGRKDVVLFAITVDEGIDGYRDDTILSAKKAADDLCIEHHIVSFEDEYGMNLDEMVLSRGKKAPCTFCGVFRKAILNRTARKLGATKVATGHDLDDEAQSVMMNYLKADVERLARFAPRKVQKGLIPRIKPLKEIPEKEVALYCTVRGLYAQMPECPYATLSLRADVKDMMNYLENKIPGTKHSVMKGFNSLSRDMAERYPQIELPPCKRCGEPSVEGVCKACELMGKLRRS